MDLPILSISAVLMIAGSAFAADVTSPTTKPDASTYRQLAGETEAVLRKDILDKWFPAAVDQQGGGFIENFGIDWKPAAQNSNRSIVYQSRLTWLAAHAAMQFPGEAQKYLELSRHGALFLAQKQWDKENGGLFWSVDAAGRPTRDRPNEKHTYGIAFAIYASAASHKVTHDPAALQLAKDAFNWLEQHAHDAKDGGYIESLTLDGQPQPAGARGNDAIGTRFGQKSMNTHIHVLEAFGELYEVWPDPTLKARMKEIFEIVRDKVYAEPGYLTLFFSPDWKRVEGRDSFGHDIEATYLLAEAAEILGISDDEQTWIAGRKLVDHALAVGFDQQNGGFYNEGTIAGENLVKDKIWWVEAEGLNSLLLLHSRYGKETSKYWDAYLKQWAFIKDHQIDHTHGGWYPTVNADGTPSQRINYKSNQWTEGYHQGRAMMNVTNRLRKLADEAK